MIQALTEEQLICPEMLFVPEFGHVVSPRLKDFLTGFNYANWVKYNSLNLLLNADKNELINIGKETHDEILSSISDFEQSGLNKFNVITMSNKFRLLFEMSIDLILKDKIVWTQDMWSYFIYDEDDKIIGSITENNFEQVNFILLQCFHQKTTKDFVNKFSSSTAEEWWKQAEERDKELKSSEKDIKDFSLSNIISKICSLGIGYTYLNIFDLTLYQLLNVFADYTQKRTADMSDNIYSNHGGDDYDPMVWLHKQD